MNKENEVNVGYEYCYESNSINILAGSKKCKSVKYFQKYFCKNLNNISKKELKEIKKIEENLAKIISDQHKGMMSDRDTAIYDYCLENNSTYYSTAEFIIQHGKEIIKLLLNQI